MSILLPAMPTVSLAHGGAAPASAAPALWSVGAINALTVLSALLIVGGIFAGRRLAWRSSVAQVGLWTLLSLFPLRMVAGTATTLGLSWGEAVNLAHLHTYLRWADAGRLLLLSLLLLAATARLRGLARELAAWLLLGAVGLSAHGEFGPDVATVSVLIHLGAAAIWAGGLAAVGWGKPGDRSLVVARFSPWAAGAALITLLTGALNLSAHNIAVRALPGTAYGLVLLLKHLFLLPMLAVALLNHLRVRRGATPLLRLLRAEAVLAAATVAVAVFLPQAADRAASAGNQPSATEAGITNQGVSISITPGQVGPNRILVEMPGGGRRPLGLRFRSLEMNMGEQAVLALPLGDGHYTVASDVLAMAGPWRIVVDRPDGVVVTSVNLAQDLSGISGTVAHSHGQGPEPWYALLVAAGLACGGAALRSRRRPAAIAAGALLTTAFVQYHAYTAAWATSLVAPPGITNPVRPDAVSAARGERIYAANCMVCHGQHGFGDGAAAVGGKLLPADLTSLHLSYHLDAQLYWWVTNGVPRTSMPGFKDTLSDAERWDVVAYVRTLRHVKEQETIPLVRQAAMAVLRGDRAGLRPLAAPALSAAVDAGEVVLPGEQHAFAVDVDQLLVTEFENELLDEGLTYRASLPGLDLFVTLQRLESRWVVTKFWVQEHFGG